jgi:surface protein
MFARTGYSSDIFDLGDIGGWDISNANNLSWMFFNAAPSATLWSIGQLNDWNTSKVTNMNRLFSSSGKNSTVWDIGDLSNWDTSKVTDMDLMFQESGQKNESWGVGDISGWNVSSLKTARQMFSRLSNLKILDLSGWNTSSLTDTASMFSLSVNLTTIYIGDGWDVSNVTSSGTMFNGASKLPNYNSNVIDKTNAHGDAGGYMTRVVRFSIEGKYYKALPGMTWLDWIQSEYSAGSDMKSWGYCVGTTSFDYYLVNGSKMVSPSDRITSSNYQLLLN